MIVITQVMQTKRESDFADTIPALLSLEVEISTAEPILTQPMADLLVPLYIEVGFLPQQRQLAGEHDIQPSTSDSTPRTYNHLTGASDQRATAGRAHPRKLAGRFRPVLWGSGEHDKGKLYPGFSPVDVTAFQTIPSDVR